MTKYDDELEKKEKLIKEIIDFLYDGLGTKYNKLNVRVMTEQIVNKYELKERFPKQQSDGVCSMNKTTFDEELREILERFTKICPDFDLDKNKGLVAEAIIQIKTLSKKVAKEQRLNLLSEINQDLILIKESNDKAKIVIEKINKWSAIYTGKYFKKECSINLLKEIRQDKKQF